MRIDRKQVIAEGAIRTLAEKGARGLTHRAVDNAAGLPQGSTSYYCKTRSALLQLVMEGVLTADRDDADQNVQADGSVDFDGLLTCFLLPENRMRGLARLELFLEAARDQEFRESLTLYRNSLIQLAVVRMTKNGMRDAEQAARSGRDAFEAKMLHALIFSETGT